MHRIFDRILITSKFFAGVLPEISDFCVVMLENSKLVTNDATMRFDAHVRLGST